MDCAEITFSGSRLNLEFFLGIAVMLASVGI
jgi:hypothetical protein